MVPQPFTEVNGSAAASGKNRGSGEGFPDNGVATRPPVGQAPTTGNIGHQLDRGACTAQGNPPSSPTGRGPTRPRTRPAAPPPAPDRAARPRVSPRTRCSAPRGGGRT